MERKEKVQIAVIVGIVFGTAAFLQMRVSFGEQEGIWIARPESGTKRQTVSFLKDDAEESFTFELRARERTAEEMDTAYMETLQRINEVINPEGKAEVILTESLTLPQYVEETGALIRWESSDEERVSRTGRVRREGLSEAHKVSLCARVTIGEECREYWFSLGILPYESGSSEAEFYQTGEELRKLEQETAAEEGFYLPEQIGAVALRLPKDRVSAPGVFAVVLCFIMLIVVAKRKERQKERQKREEEFLMAYPQLVTKLTLYVGAGLSLRGAWERLAAEYRKKVEASGKEKVVYAEVLLLAGELKNGTSEAAAYEAFGRRIGLKPYLRCASLLVSQLQKGSGGLREGLENEVRLAWEIRRRQAERQGEEAQTKLLFPMMGMLLLVLALVMFPAFYSMGI